MKSLKYVLSTVALTGALTMSASATFIVDPDPGGEKLFIDVANKNVSDFDGSVGANNSSAPHGAHGVPDKGATALLLGSGLAAIGLVRRYLKR